MAPGSTGGPRLCVFLGLFSVPITDYQTREETEQGLSGLVRVGGAAGTPNRGGYWISATPGQNIPQKKVRKMNFPGNSGTWGDS